jgi:hypothetical protein
MKLRVTMSARWDHTMKLDVEAENYFICIERATDRFIARYGGYPWKLVVKRR